MKEAGYVWKRIRRSLKEKRDWWLFHKFHKHLIYLHKREKKGEIDLYYFDETSFSLVPSISYAWQKKGEQIELPSQKGSTHTVLGFMNKELDFHPFIVKGSANAEIVIACVDQFCNQIRTGKSLKHKTYIILDNAPPHISKKFKAKIKEWKSKGIVIRYLPKYSPELNLIEILWRFIKFQWLPFEAFIDADSLVKELNYVLENIGTKYRISFS